MIEDADIAQDDNNRLKHSQQKQKIGNAMSSETKTDSTALRAYGSTTALSTTEKVKAPPKRRT